MASPTRIAQALDLLTGQGQQIAALTTQNDDLIAQVAQLGAANQSQAATIAALQIQVDAIPAKLDLILAGQSEHRLKLLDVEAEVMQVLDQQ